MAGANEDVGLTSLRKASFLTPMCGLKAWLHLVHQFWETGTINSTDELELSDRKVTDKSSNIAPPFHAKAAMKQLSRQIHLLMFPAL